MVLVETLRRTQEPVLNPVHGLRKVFERRKQQRTAEGYLAAYQELRDSLSVFFEANKDKVRPSIGDSSATCILLDPEGYDRGCNIELKGEQYKLHLVSKVYDLQGNIMYDGKVQKHSTITVKEQGATAVEQLRLTPQDSPSGMLLPIALSDVRISTLSTEEAEDLAFVLRDENYFRPVAYDWAAESTQT